MSEMDDGVLPYFGPRAMATRDLRLNLYRSFIAGEKRHPLIIMRELGVNFLFVVPQSISDCWWFLGCTNVPSELPNFITDMNFADPRELVGYGLSIEMADELIAARKNAEVTDV